MPTKSKTKSKNKKIQYYLVLRNDYDVPDVYMDKVEAVNSMELEDKILIVESYKTFKLKSKLEEIYS